MCIKMNFLTYWDMFGVVLIVMYFILSWLFPKRAQKEKPQEKAKKEGYSRSQALKEGEAERKKDGVSPEGFITGENDISEFVFATSRSSPFGSAHTEFTPQVVTGSSYEKDSSSEETIETTHRSDSISENGIPFFKETIDSIGSLQDAKHASNSTNDELSSGTSSKFSELKIPLTDNSLSLSEIPEKDDKKIILIDESNVDDDEKDVPKPIQFEELTSDSYVECKNSDDGFKGLPAVDVVDTAFLVSDFSDNLNVNSRENDASRKIESTRITSCNAEEASSEIIAESTNSIDFHSTPPPSLPHSQKMSSLSSLEKGEHLEKFADDLANTAIGTAVDNTVSLNTFAESLSERIFSDSADDVISEVQASLEKQEKENEIQKELELEEIESLGTCVASEVVNEAIGEAALKKEYMNDFELDMTSAQNIQPHIGFVVENVVNSAICEAASKLKRDQAEETITSTSINSEEESIGLFTKSSDNETKYNNEPTLEAVTLPQDNMPLKGNEAENEVIDEEVSKLASEVSSELINKSLTKDVSIEPFCDDLVDSVDKQLKEQDTEPVNENEDTQNVDKLAKADINLSELSVKLSKESAETENNAEAHTAVAKTITENLSIEPLSKDVIESVDKQLEEQDTQPVYEADDGQNVDKSAEVDIKPFGGDLSEQSEKLPEESVVTENNSAAAEEVEPFAKTDAEEYSTSPVLTDTEKKEELTFSDELIKKSTPEQGVLTTDNFELPKNKLEKFVDGKGDKSQVIPEIKLTSDNDSGFLDNKIENETSPPGSPEIATQKTTLQKKDNQTEDGKDSFWRRSLILDLEEDLDFEDSISSEPYEVTSPKHSKGEKEITSHLDDESDDFTDSEEDEIIDHDAEAKLGAVGGQSKEITDQPVAREFDLYDYEQDDYDDEEEDDDDLKNFEPVFTVDGLCVSRQQEKERPKVKSVGSHYNRALVLDNGSGIIKLGYAGDRVPRVIQQNVSGIPQRYSMHITGMESNMKDYKKYGNEAISKAGVMHISHPMKSGLIDSWTDIEDIWEFMIYDELGAEVGDNPILVTEVSQNPKKNREKIAQILFEHLNVPAMYLADQLPLSLYASGMTSGVCLSSGYSCTQAAVVYEGHTLSYTSQQLDIGGGDLTENLKILLRDVRARNFTTSSGWQIVNNIKETIAFVAKDYDHDIAKYQKNDSLTQYYKLPDGQLVDIGYECMSCVEPLFQPDKLMLANSTIASQLPVHKLIDSALKRCNPDLQKLCYRNIVLSGGTTTLKGFTTRLQHELHQLNHNVHKIRSPEHRRYSPWIGGSILASLPLFYEQYVTLEDYSDCGAQIVHKKCF